MNSSARASTDCGIVRPSAFAVLRLITKLKLGRLLDREVGGLGAFEDLIDVRGCAAKEIGIVRPIGHEATSLDEFPRPRNGWQAVLEREIHDLWPVGLDCECHDETIHARPAHG